MHIKQMFLILIAAVILVTGNSVAAGEDVTVVKIFNEQTIHFNQDNPAEYVSSPDKCDDNGRVVLETVQLPDMKDVKIEGLLKLIPIPKDERSVYDRWDRAGNICLVTENGVDIEVVRFMTSYGGYTEHEIDVSHLAPILRNECTFKAFVDTWASPGWKVDFSLRYEPFEPDMNPDWNSAVYYTNSFNQQDMPDGVGIDVNIPEDFGRIVLNYISTGHCTDGRDDDEFISKPNVIYVDGISVYRFHPWRDDCRDYRELNPYCAKWTDGSWSSDYSRSGWCPGAEVIPEQIDLTDHLTAGDHKIKIVIENMRPVDEKDHFGYWRVSAHLVGWKEYPQIWRNIE